MSTCTKCNGPLIKLSSMNIKICADCKATFPWKLKAGQEPLVKATR